MVSHQGVILLDLRVWRIQYKIKDKITNLNVGFRQLVLEVRWSHVHVIRRVLARQYRALLLQFGVMLGSLVWL